MRWSCMRCVLRSTALVLGVSWSIPPESVQAEPVSLTSINDNTLYEYNPADPNSRLSSNGSGDFFSSGRTFSRSQIRRGLLQFDFSAVPADAVVVPGSATLNLYVVDVPKKDAADRPFWLIPVTGRVEQWGEGTSTANAGVSGAGSGAAAQEGDATWFHTQYDPASHEPKLFVSGGSGYWIDEGVLGNEPLDSWNLFGDPVGMVASEIGPVRLSSAGMESDINDWMQLHSVNAGWLIIGDESIASDSQSSNRGFASREHADVQLRPQLKFQYTLVPEPASAVLFAAGTLLLVCRYLSGRPADKAQLAARPQQHAARMSES